MLEHHRTRPDLADRVGDAAAGNVGCRAMHRLEHRGVFACGVDVARGCYADRADHGGAEIGQDVAKQVRADHDIEPIGVADEMRGQDIDVVLVGPDIGIVARDGSKPLIPERHRVDDAVRLGRRGDVLLAGAGELEGVAHDAVAAAAGEDRLLHRHLEFGAGIKPAADFRILAFVVFADDIEVDIARSAVAQRRLDAGQQPHGAEVDVLVEAASQGDQQAPQRDVIGYFGWPTHRAKEYCIDSA